MNKVPKTHLITLRITESTREAIQKSQRDYISRDGVPYNFTEVARYLLNAGLHKEGKLRHSPTLDGHGARTLEMRTALIDHSRTQAQRQLKRLDDQTSRQKH
jgi:hypothetical protein